MLGSPAGIPRQTGSEYSEIFFSQYQSKNSSFSGLEGVGRLEVKYNFFPSIEKHGASSQYSPENFAGSGLPHCPSSNLQYMISIRSSDSLCSEVMQVAVMLILFSVYSYRSDIPGFCRLALIA